MGRYYSIVIGSETESSISGAASNNAGATFTNQVQGPNGPIEDLGAPQIELDIQTTFFQDPVGIGGFVRIWGVSLQQIAQASDFNGAPITVKAGMQTGLPLASAQASQSGIILTGQVYQAYGNWLGINQTLDIYVQYDGGATTVAPKNIVVNWLKGQTFANALQPALQTAYPNYTVDINISPNLVSPEDVHGVYATIQRLASAVYAASMGGSFAASNPNYSGVGITINQSTIIVSDNVGNPTPATGKMLNAQDFVGQITWLGPYTINFSLVMRSDIQVGDYIQFPQVLTLQAQTTPQSQSFARNQTTFSGTWQVVYVRHLGNSRGPTGQDWMTTYQAISSTAPSSAYAPVNSSA